MYLGAYGRAVLDNMGNLNILLIFDTQIFTYLILLKLNAYGYRTVLRLDLLALALISVECDIIK